MLLNPEREQVMHDKTKSANFFWVPHRSTNPCDSELDGDEGKIVLKADQSSQSTLVDSAQAQQALQSFPLSSSVRGQMCALSREHLLQQQHRWHSDGKRC